MFTVSRISYEHRSKEECIGVLPWGTCIVLRNLYCSHSAVVHDKLVSLQKELSSIFPAVIIIPELQPFTWRWDLRSRDHRLCPTVTGLVSSLFVFWKSTACVGGQYLYFLCVNCFRIPLINSGRLVQSYSKTSNRSSGHSQLSTVSGVAAKAQKAGVTSS